MENIKDAAIRYRGNLAKNYGAKLQNTRPLVISYHVATVSLDTRSELGSIIFRWIYTRPELVNIYLFLID